MAQFDVHRLIGTDLLVVDLQSGVAHEFNSRLVAPIVPPTPLLKAVRRINRDVHFDSQAYVFMPQLISAVRIHELGPPIGNVAEQRDQPVAALDVLFVGS